MVRVIYKYIVIFLIFLIYVSNENTFGTTFARITPSYQASKIPKYKNLFYLPENSKTVYCLSSLKLQILNFHLPYIKSMTIPENSIKLNTETTISTKCSEIILRKITRKKDHLILVAWNGKS